MKQITDKEYKEWLAYKEEKSKCHILMPDTLRFICESCHYDPGQIGQHILEILPTVCPHSPRSEVVAVDDPEKEISSEVNCLR